MKVVISDFKSALPAWQVYHSVAQESQGKRLRAVEPWSRERCLATWPWSRRPRRRPCRGCGCRAAHGLQARTRGCLLPINLFRVHVNRNVTLCLLSIELLFMLRECPMLMQKSSNLCPSSLPASPSCRTWPGWPWWRGGPARRSSVSLFSPCCLIPEWRPFNLICK